VTTNSNTFDAADVRRPARSADTDGRGAVGSRSPRSPLPAPAPAARHAEPRHDVPQDHQPDLSPDHPAHHASGDRTRAALLIVFAVIALSAFAAIGWLQYQARGDRADPQFEISAPVPAAPEPGDGRS